MVKPPSTGPAAEYRARLDRLGVKLPVRHDRENIGTILDAKGGCVAVVDVDRELNDRRVTGIAEGIAAAINWYAGLERGS